MGPARKAPDTSTYSGRFAVRLRQLREKSGLSVEELAAEIGVAPTTIYGWESSYRSPKIEDFPRLAGALKLKKVRDLFPNE